MTRRRYKVQVNNQSSSTSIDESTDDVDEDDKKLKESNEYCNTGLEDLRATTMIQKVLLLLQEVNNKNHQLESKNLRFCSSRLRHDVVLVC